MTTTVTLYTKPNCTQCTATKKAFLQRGVEYTSHDIVDDPARQEIVRQLGYQALPVVILTDEENKVLDHWTGFAISKIDLYFPKQKKES